jgi:hypothetical protein
MEYTDNETTKWWSDKSELEKIALFEYIIERADEGFASVVKSWQRRFDSAMTLSPRTLATLRKWDRFS